MRRQGLEGAIIGFCPFVIGVHVYGAVRCKEHVDRLIMTKEIVQMILLNKGAL